MLYCLQKFIDQWCHN